MSKFRQIWLEEEGDAADGIPVDITDIDGTTTVRIKCVDYVRLEYSSDSLEAKALKEKLVGSQREKRFLIYKTGDPTKPLIVAEKRANYSNES